MASMNGSVGRIRIPEALRHSIPGLIEPARLHLRTGFQHLARCSRCFIGCNRSMTRWAGPRLESPGSDTDACRRRGICWRDDVLPAFDIEACLRARHGSKPFFQEPLEEEVPAIDGRLLDHSLFITPPQDDRQARRWCLEQAVRATSIDAVVVDGSGFSPLDSRRLQVAIAERKRRDESPLLVLMVRPPCERLVRSSAITRWAVASSSTECPDDPRVAGWSVRLLRARMPQASPSMENAVVGQVHAEWDLHFDGPSKRVESASSSLVSSFASSCTSSSDDSVGSIKKETHVDTISFDPISMVGHRSGSATQSPSGNRSTTPQDERLFEEIVLPAERRQGVARGRRRHGIRSRSADSGGWNTSGWATSARMLFSGGSKGDSPRHDACRSEVAGDAGSRARGTVIAEER